MNVFGIGLPEIAVIGALALVIFGPKRLPELGRTLGKTLKGFQSASNEFEQELKKAISEDPSPDDPPQGNASNTQKVTPFIEDSKAEDPNQTSI